MYVKTIGDGGMIYPFSPEWLRSENPDTSFPDVMSDELLAEWGVHPVARTEQPAPSALETVLQAPPELVKGVWTQRWNIVAKPREEAVAALWASVKALRDHHISSGVTVEGVGVLDSDFVSRLNLVEAVAMAQHARKTKEPFAVAWKLADNTFAAMDTDGMIAAGLAMARHVAACHARAQELGLEIGGPKAKLDQIDVTAGWPKEK